FAAAAEAGETRRVQAVLVDVEALGRGGAAQAGRPHRADAERVVALRDREAPGGAAPMEATAARRPRLCAAEGANLALEAADGALGEEAGHDAGAVLAKGALARKPQEGDRRPRPLRAALLRFLLTGARLRGIRGGLERVGAGEDLAVGGDQGAEGD